jgi:hypothetical protein
MNNPLVDTVLDDLIHDLAQSALNSLDKHIPNCSNELRVQYIGRALAEVLSIIVCSAPAEQVQELSDNLCKSIQLAVSHNVSIEQLLIKTFGQSPEKNLSLKIKEMLN